MKTIFVKAGIWLFIAMFISLLVFVINLNIVNKVDNFVNRESFEKFLNEKLTNLLQEEENVNDKKLMADSPDKAALMDYFTTLDPELKLVPKQRLKEAYSKTRELQKQMAYKSTEQMEWQGTLSNMGGRVRAIMWDPNDPLQRKIWAGAVTGGLWYKQSVIDNEPWLPVNDFWPGLAISCMTYDPNNTQSFYVGTGEAQTALIIYRESSGIGFGIMHSPDGGINWDIMPGTEDFEYINDIEIMDEDGTSVMYAAVASGVYKGSIHQSQPSDGLYRHVLGSDEWDQVLPNIPNLDVPHTPSDIEIAADGRIFVGSMQNVEGNGGATILYSDSGLEGSWFVNEEYKVLIEGTAGFDLPGRVILAAAPSDANRVYALVAQGYWYGLPAYECHILARTDNQGEDWEMIAKPPNVSGRNWAFIAWHALTAAVDPANPDRIYVGALNVFRSDNAGETWQVKSSWTGGGTDFIHADQHRILYQPGSSNKALVCSDGGVFYTVNASVSSPIWQMKNQGFNTLQFYKCAITPSDTFNLYIGGMQDNGTVWCDGLNPIDNFQNKISGGDGGACFIDKNEPDVMITSSQNNHFTFLGNYQITAQTGATWESGNFISAMDYDYKMNTLYANAVTVINFNSDSILRLSGIPYGPFDGDYLDMQTGSTVPFTYVGYSDHSPEGAATLYLGSMSGRAFKVENAETNPMVTEIGSDDFPAASISCIAIGRSEDTLMVTFSNYGVSSIWQSYDNGTTWIEKEGDLPDIPVRWAIYHPASAKAAILATELGAWTSYNLNEENVHWLPDNSGLANVRIDMLQLRDADNTILAGTHGRGFYTTTFNYNPPTGIRSIASEKYISVFPNPASEYVQVKIKNTEILNNEITLLDATGKIIKQEKLNKNQIKLDLSALSRGTYFIKVNGMDHLALQKIIKQ